MKGSDWDELLVAAAAVEPHEYGKASRPVEHGEPVMPSVHAVGDALVGTGDEGAAVGDVWAAQGRVQTDDDEPASNIERHEGLRGKLVPLEELHL